MSDMQTIERAIGEEFDYEGVLLKVIVDQRGALCDGCYFVALGRDCMDRQHSITGSCVQPCRNDGNDILFIKL